MSIDAFILAGGRSSRFGSDKMLLKIEGQSVIEKISAEIDKAFTGAVVRVVAANNAQLSVSFGRPFIFDLYPERGPWSGVHAALAYARSEWILALACDHPFVTAELFERLFQHATEEFDAIVPIQDDGRPQPLCAFYRRDACLPVAEETVTSSRPTPPLRTMFEKVRTCEVSFDEVKDLPSADRFFANINTLQDLERLSTKAA